MIRDIAVFIFLKRRFQNSTIYRYNAHRSSKGLGVNRNTMNKYVIRFLRMGWCEMRGNDLFFKNVNETACVDKGNRKRLKLDGTINEIMQEIRLLVLRQKQEQFEWVLKKESKDSNLTDEEYLDKILNAPTMEVAMSRYPRKKLEFYENCHFFISFKKIGQLFGCCAATAYKIVEKMKRSKVIQVFHKEMGFLKKRREVYTGYYYECIGNKN